jgi:hypothetical protein
MREVDPEFEAWKNKAREADILSVASQLGINLRKSGRDHIAACPTCGGKDRNEFICTPSKSDPGKRWHCRKSAVGGDPIAMHMHVTGSDFMGACEDINREPPPRGNSGRKADPEAIRERRAEVAEDQKRRDEEDRRADQKKMMKAADVWDHRKPIRGTMGWRYFADRKIDLTEEEVIDIAFIPSLEYYGFPDGQTDEQKLLGSYPAVVSAVRSVSGELTAVHRTYLQPTEPKKLRPPGCQRRNKAKKIVGKAGGGIIRLGFIGPVLAIGEGIETTLSWARLGATTAEFSTAAGVSLGNIAGSATDTVPHPRIPDGRPIPNGIPNLDAPGLILPPEVEEVILLGDGDSDPEFTRATLLVAARRFRAAGKLVSVTFAPPGKDFNDVLIELAGQT